MKSCGETFTTRTIVEKVLRTLNSKFDFIAVALEESKNLDVLKLEELQGSLESQKHRLNERESSKTVAKQVLLTQTSKKVEVDRARVDTAVEVVVTKTPLLEGMARISKRGRKFILIIPLREEVPLVLGEEAERNLIGAAFSVIIAIGLAIMLVSA
jgi:hypothetical protein